MDMYFSTFKRTQKYDIKFEMKVAIWKHLFTYPTSKDGTFFQNIKKGTRFVEC